MNGPGISPSARVAKDAAFEATASQAVTGVGAPT
jgi:hypothetical protein